MNVYDFSVQAQDGSEVALEEFRGKVLLIVNTATDWGFTPQYEVLQNIYEEFHSEGFEIIDLPCNQFGGQAPGSNEEIHSFCTGRYGITFPQYAKIDILGENAHPLYKWITENTTFGGFSGPAKMVLGPVVKKMDKDYKKNGNIKWNFTKILIDRNGDIAGRFEAPIPLEKVKAKIREIL